MAWFSGKNTWGNFPDLAGAVNKLQESVKNIEKNFDTALGFEDKSESSISNEGAGSWPLPRDPKSLFNLVMAFMGNNSEESAEETSEKLESPQQDSGSEESSEKSSFPDLIPVGERKTDNAVHTTTEETTVQEENEVLKVEEDGEQTESVDETTAQNLDDGKTEDHLPEMPVEFSESIIQHVESLDSVVSHQENDIAEVGNHENLVVLMQPKGINLGEDQVEGSTTDPGESHGISDVQEIFQVETDGESKEEEMVQAEENVEKVSSLQPEASGDSKKRDEAHTSVLSSVATVENYSVDQTFNEHLSRVSPSNESSEMVSELDLRENEATVTADEGDHVANDVETDIKEQRLSSVTNMSDSDSILEMERVTREMKMMEAAVQGAARQAQLLLD